MGFYVLSELIGLNYCSRDHYHTNSDIMLSARRISNDYIIHVYRHETREGNNGRKI
jgi:hypothetical protein